LSGGGAGDRSAGAARRLADVAAYREATADVVAELAGRGGGRDPATAERVLIRRLPEPEFAMLFSAMPAGPDAALDRVLREVRTYRPSDRSSAGSLATMIRIALLTQIEVLWWGHVPAYESDGDVLGSPDLLDLEPLRRGGKIAFQYRYQAVSVLGRAARAAERRAAGNRVPNTAGLRNARARPELVVLLNQVAIDFARHAPPGTPPLWVTSLTRSNMHQRHLRALGYAALLPSAHCVGSAADIEMSWFRQFDACESLQALLIERQRAGEANVIDEGQAWHVCLRPGAGRALRLIPSQPRRPSSG
jgi:hypothetical protein